MRVPVATIRVTVPFPVPDAGESVSQAALSMAVQLSVLPPALLMLKVCAVGLPLPCWAVKDRLVGLAPLLARRFTYFGIPFRRQLQHFGEGRVNVAGAR